MLEGLAEFRAAGCNVTMPFMLTTLAETYGLDGESEEGLKRIAEAIALLKEHKSVGRKPKYIECVGRCCYPTKTRRQPRTVSTSARRRAAAER